MRGAGRVLFAAILLTIAGVLNIIYGIGAIDDANFYPATGTHYVFGSLHTVDANGAVQQRQVHWVYWVREGKVQRAVSFARRDQAEEAAHRSG